MLETNVKASRVATFEWTFASHYFIFFGKFVSVLEPLKKGLFDVPTTQVIIFVFFVSAGV